MYKAGEYPACFINQMAEELGINSQSIASVENSDKEWPDTCLGCPEPDQSCGRVITPYRKLVLKSQQKDSNGKWRL